MIRRWLPAAVAVGLVVLSAPAGAAAAGPTWPYVVQSASGSAVWRYIDAGGGGVDSVSFRGHVRSASGLLHLTTTYMGRNSQGCGPRSKVTSWTGQAPSFSLDGSYVVVTWRFPLPKLSYCHGPGAGGAAALLQVGRFSQKLPLSRFTCPAVSLKLIGQASVPLGRTFGTLSYQTTIVLTRKFAISVSL